MEIILSGLLLLVGLSMLISGRFVRRNMLFGVFVPDAHIDDINVLSLLKQYRMRIIYTTVGAAILNLLLFIILAEDNIKMIVLLLLTFFLLFVGIGIYKSSHDKLMLLKQKEEWMNDVKIVRATDTSIKKDIHLAPVGLYLIPLLILSIAVIYVAMNYQAIPDRIAVHWNINNEPDRWEDKSIWSVFLSAFIGYGIMLLLLFAGNAISSIPMMLNPAAKEASKSYERKVRQNNSYLMLILAIVLSIVFSFILIQPVIYDAGYMPPYVLPVIILGMIIPVIFSMIYQFRADKAYRDAAVLSDKAPYNQEEHYKWGLFYYNKEDHNLWVPKVSQFGMTINFARPGAIIFIIFILALIFIPLLIPFLIK